MIKILVFVSIILSFTASLRAGECDYWTGKADPEVDDVKPELDEENSENIINGIACLLTLQGNTRDGVLTGHKFKGEQTVPRASVEINALHQISELFYGNDDFATAVALVGVPIKRSGEYDEYVFNAKEDIEKAFASYRKWFEKVKEIGLEEARKQKLDPLAGSKVAWY